MERIRSISVIFVNDLKDGCLKPVLDRVRADATLFLAIRNGYINIYYRGGNLMKIVDNGDSKYIASFDKNYDLDGGLQIPHGTINKSDASQAWVAAFPRIKEAMDLWFSHHPKLEREFQQVVARENNNSSVSNQTEYFITDVEYADTGTGARFDMLAIKWLRSKRKHGGSCIPAFIEMKFGDKALAGSSGLTKHLNDFTKFINADAYQDSLKAMQSQFSIMRELKLIRFGSNGNDYVVTLDAQKKPEVIFMLAGHNPDSPKLGKFLEEVRNLDLDKLPFDLRFYVANFAGYGLHDNCMYDLAKFSGLVDVLGQVSMTEYQETDHSKGGGSRDCHAANHPEYDQDAPE